MGFYVNVKGYWLFCSVIPVENKHQVEVNWSLPPVQEHYRWVLPLLYSITSCMFHCNEFIHFCFINISFMQSEAIVCTWLDDRTWRTRKHSVLSEVKVSEWRRSKVKSSRCVPQMKLWLRSHFNIIVDNIIQNLGIH